VADVLMEEPHAQHWGDDISRRGGIRSGVLYPILQRLLDYGWLEDGWEDRAEISDKRPPRRYYELTPEGEAALARVLRDAPADGRFRRLAERPI
jgi:PadR family transcriptional regulator, regulatory protein PadR